MAVRRGAGRQRLQDAGDRGHRTLAGRSGQGALGACPHPGRGLRVSPDPTSTLPAAALKPPGGTWNKHGGEGEG